MTPLRRARVPALLALGLLALAAARLALRSARSPPTGAAAPAPHGAAAERRPDLAPSVPRPRASAVPAKPEKASEEPRRASAPPSTTRAAPEGPWPFTLLLRAVDPEGSGVADAVFELAGRSAARRRTLGAGRDGTCVIELEADLRAPRLRQLLVVAGAPGRVEASRLVLDEELPPAGGLLAIELVLAPGATVEVRVRDPLGAPAAGAFVRLVCATDDSRVRRLEVGADGVARGDRFAPGTWTLQVDGWRRWARGPYELVRLEPDRPNVFELLARRHDELQLASGRVLAGDGSELSPDELAELFLRPVGQRVAGARLHEDAAFFVPIAPDARQRWEISDRRGAARSAPFTLRGGWHGIEVRLAPGR